MTGTKVIGARLLRKEDYRFVTGQGRYLDDMVFPGCLHAHFVRSPHAHARIAAIDCTAALKSDGVVAIVTGRELAEWTAPARMAPPIEGLHPVEFTTLPIDKVRFIGDPVACERLPSNLVSRQNFSAGDPARRFSEAEIIVEVSFHQSRFNRDLEKLYVRMLVDTADDISSGLGWRATPERMDVGA
jgi:carbon-monoxide dehydrogenase large subunit